MLHRACSALLVQKELMLRCRHLPGSFGVLRVCHAFTQLGNDLTLVGAIAIQIQLHCLHFFVHLPTEAVAALQIAQAIASGFLCQHAFLVRTSRGLL
eukprot:Skav222846  [mRNA]  locus=scaffold1263:267726:269711:- [translate_table: standard]